MISIRCMVRSSSSYRQVYQSLSRTRRRPRLSSCRCLVRDSLTSGSSSGSFSSSSTPSGEQHQIEKHPTSSHPHAVDPVSEDVTPPAPSSSSTSTRSSKPRSSAATSATGATAVAVESAGELAGEADADAVAAAAAAALAAAATAQPPKVLFPWRHETADNMLPRLIAGTPESLYNTSVLPMGSQNFIASMFLTIPWWQTMLGLDWRGDLAESSAYALTKGVAGIVSNVYHIPLSDVLVHNSTTTDSESDLTDDNQKMDFLYGNIEPPSPSEASSGPPSESASNEDTASASSSSSEQKSISSTQAPKSSDFCPEVEYMLDRPLRQLFQSAHQHGRDQLQIRLQMTPTSRSMVYSVFCLPFVTKAASERNPELLERLRKIMIKTSRSDFSGGFGSMYEYVLEQVERHDRLETTVELQVLVECDEIFQVIDRETGMVVQGSADGGVRRVWHLVCLETTSTTTFAENFPYLPNTTRGNWIITDIDDLLGPKKWYHK